MGQPNGSLKKYQTYFPSQDIKQNGFLNSCLANCKSHKLEDLISRILSSQPMADIGKKRDERIMKI